MDRKRTLKTFKTVRPGPDGSDLPLEGRVTAIVEPRLISLGYELVRVAITGSQRRPTVQIMADRVDGRPVDLEDCALISRVLGAALDVEDLIPGAWTLEVSSPGIDRPLTRIKDWNRFAGHMAQVELKTPLADNRRRFSGIVLGAATDGARLRLQDGQEIVLPLAQIHHARLVLTEALLAVTAPHLRAN